MITFERIMGFLLLGMVIYLLNPLVVQIGAVGFQWALVFLVAVAMACWLLGKVTVTMPDSLRHRYRGGAVAVVLGAGALIFGWIYPPGEAARQVQMAKAAAEFCTIDWGIGVPWRRWSPLAVEETVRSGQLVFVDFTATYCTGCKVNKKMVIDTPEVREKMNSLGVVPFQGDFTNGDPEVFEMLKKLGRAGVPLNLIYPAGKPDSPILLDTVLTKPYLLKKLDEFAAVRTPSASPSHSGT
jgi:thiol:disulfide interchange protein